MLLVETPRSWYQKHQAMKPIDKLKHEVKQPPQLQQKEKREAVCFFKPFRVANGMTSLPSMLAMLTELSQQLPAGRLTRESSGACCYGGAFRNLEASPVGRGCHLRLRKFVTCDSASLRSHICHLRLEKPITCNSSPFSIQTRKGVGWGVLTFLLQLGFHVNSFPAQSMVDSHMLAAQLTGLGGELQSCEKKTKPVAENSFK